MARDAINDVWEQKKVELSSAVRKDAYIFSVYCAMSLGGRPFMPPLRISYCRRCSPLLLLPVPFCFLLLDPADLPVPPDGLACASPGG